MNQEFFKKINNCQPSDAVTIYFGDLPAYEILFRKDYLGLKDAVSSLGMIGRRFMLVSDSNVSRLYLEECMELLRPISKETVSFVFTAGEASKNLDTVSECYERLIGAGFDRGDVLVALGGGVVGDLTGFVAATYLRGIRFIQLPTSLLSMVDSSIGGKTGVDFKAYKNMVGAFHQPSLVYMNLSALSTLKQREFSSGMSEIIKHGLIKDKTYYTWLKEHKTQILAMEYEVLKEMIHKSCLIKKKVVEADPKESGERAVLNFGHTIGHSVEKLKDLSLLHGECVATGIAAASYLSMKRGNLTALELEDILETLKFFGQPTTISGLAADDIYTVTKSDKKMNSDMIRFILLQNIGEAVIDPTVNREEMLEAIRYILR